MMMSGAFKPGGQKSMKLAQANFDFLAFKTGCRTVQSKVVECLQSLPSTVLSELLRRGNSSHGSVDRIPFPSGWLNSTWVPTVDGVILTDTAETLARQGHAQDVPVLLGSA